MRRPETQYTVTADGVRIAYQVFGRGDVDLLYVPGWISHVELNWREPRIASFLERLAEFARVVIVDKRGTGCSHKVESVPDLETRMDDVRAVLDEEGFGRVVLLGESSGAAMSALFAATYPERTRAVILSGASARTRWSPDYPWGMQQEDYARELALIESGWETGEFVRAVVIPILAPSLASDETFVRWFIDYHRAACSRDQAIAMSEMWWEIDYRAVLPAINVPALVIGGPDTADATGYIASRIPGARRWTAPHRGAMWAGDGAAVADAIHDFLIAVRDEESDFQRVLATILFTDIVDSTAQAAALGDRRWAGILREHNEMVESHLARFHGRAIKHTGDGVLATFDGPARAIRCALAMTRAVRRLGIEIRAGLHTGEVEFVGDDVHGIAVPIAARVMATAGASDVIVSQTLRDLVAGSGLAFEDLGPHSLKGIPGEWRLYRASDQYNADQRTRAPY